jgi:4-amino-4-deoxy-L-arabinose transferase-like glycosyltransferase
MPSAHHSAALPLSPRTWRLLAALLIVGSALLRLLYLALNCPLDLAPDEAHYWDWSRHLDWSYYSKGPLVAYLIRLSCELVGPWSRWLTGSEMLAVRLPAVVCGSLLLLSLYVLTRQVFGREGLATAVVAMALTLPLVAAGSSLMTIDAPYTCCWGWALVLGYRAACGEALRSKRPGCGFPAPWAWPAAGLLLALGILAKYTMILWLPSFVCFLLSSPAQRRLLLRPGFWLMTGIAAAGCLPIVYWNVQHDWVSLRHVSGQAGLEEGEGFRWWGPVSYVAMQFLLLLGVWFVAWLAALVARRPGQAVSNGERYLWWMSVPMFATFFLFSFRTEQEPNWPVTAYLSGLVLMADWLRQQLRSAWSWYRRWTLAWVLVACALGLGVTLLMHYSTLIQPQLAQLSGPATEERPLPLRRFDPTCRLRGWRHLAAEVDRVCAELRSRGIEPVLATSGWTFPGELAFYCSGHPQVYSLGLALGDRHSQYDLWRPNPLADPGVFRGRTVVFVGELSPVICEGFQNLEPSRVVTYQEEGQPISRWKVTVCHGYRGFPQPAPGGRF